MLLEERLQDMDFTDRIEKNIQRTAEKLQSGSVIDVESMIPLMDDSPYPNKIMDVPYGTLTKKEKLDIFYPDSGRGPWPVFMEVHGGAWYFGQKKSVEFEPFLAGLERGFACVSLGYTLSPEGHYPLPVQEIKAAVRFLRKNAEKYCLDPEKIVLWGGSAGAHLASLAAVSCDTGYLDKDLFGLDAVSAKPDVLALWFGCFDYLHNGRFLEDWIYQNFFGTENLAAIRRILELSSPLSHITEKVCPTLLQHGTADTTVPWQQSQGYYDALVKAGAGERCRLDLLPGCRHADAAMFARENVEKVFDFAETFLGRTGK